MGELRLGVNALLEERIQNQTASVIKPCYELFAQRKRYEFSPNQQQHPQGGAAGAGHSGNGDGSQDMDLSALPPKWRRKIKEVQAVKRRKLEEAEEASRRGGGKRRRKKKKTKAISPPPVVAEQPDLDEGDFAELFDDGDDDDFAGLLE